MLCSENWSKRTHTVTAQLSALSVCGPCLTSRTPSPLFRGLITYTESALLYNPAVNTVATLQRVATVMSHELAHQWFGNLVSAAWWSQLWLKEGFATYSEYLGPTVTNPELLMPDQFISVAQRQALAFDSGPASHPIDNVDTISGSFDSIDYAKGGSVLRMVQGMLGEAVFIAGLRSYLRHFQYSSAYSTDLFSELTAAAALSGMDVNVTEVMREWTAVAGYPIVNCTTAPQGDTVLWTCTQLRFYSYNTSSPANSTWTIYLTYTTPSASLPPMWWPATQQGPLTFSVPASVAFVKLNANTTGFFRVAYDAPSYAALSAALNRPGHSGIPHDDRLGLVNDAFVLATLGRQSWPATLNLSLFLQHDTSFPVWQVAYPALMTVWNNVMYTDVRDVYSEYLRQAMSGVALQLNLTGGPQSVSDSILETLMGSGLLRFRVSGRVDELQRIFDELFAGRRRVADVNPNLLDLVLEAGVTDGGRSSARWDWVYTRFYLQLLWNNTDNSTSDDVLNPLGFPAIIRVLTATHFPDRLQAVLNSTLNSTLPPLSIAAQHRLTFLLGVVRNELGLPLFNAWLLAPDTFARLQMSLGTAGLGQLLLVALGLNSVQADIDALAGFLAAKDVEQSVRNATTSGLNTARARLPWLAAQLPPLRAYLQSGVWRRA